MAQKDLNKMSLDELKSLRKDVDSAIADFENRKRREAMKALESVAKEHGMTIGEIVSGSGGKRKKPKAPAKFRNPETPSETWSGRGRQPGWFKDAIAKGTSPEDMAV